MSPITNFSSGYQPPGIYIDAESTGAFTTVGLGATVVCLVGHGIGYEINTENVSFASSDTASLTKQYVDNASIVVSAELDTGNTTFILTEDYTVTTSGNVTTITRVTGGAIPTDRVVHIAYHYADDSYYKLNKFIDFATLQTVYGAPLDPTTGAIQSPIAFAAQLAFGNGASEVYAIALDGRNPGGGAPTTQAQFAAAYLKLLPTFAVNLVVPLWTDVDTSGEASSYLTDLASFLNTAENQQSPLMALAGVMGTYLTDDPETLATAAANKRIVLVWPERMLYFNTVLNQSTAQCDGIYLAAACAGYLSGQAVNRGLTQAQLQGFTGIPHDVLNVMTRSKKDTWSSLGVSVAEINRLNQLVIRHGVTTDTSNVGTREISVVREADAVLDTIQVTLIGANLIGTPITVDTPLQISSMVDGALQSLLLAGTITSYANLSVVQAPGPDNDPTAIQVTFSYKPTYPLNYITVTLTLDLTTNSVSVTSTEQVAA